MRSLRRPTGGLWGNPDFVKLWTGQSISELGSQVSQLAIPLLAVTGLHATPLEFSLLGVLGFLPFILFALPAGAWVDRLARRPILIAGDATRAALLVLQFAIGVCTVFFDVAYQSYLPSLVERDQLVEGNSKLQLTVSVTQVAGPSASGVLIAAITAPYAILADATSFVISTVFLLRMRHREPRHETAAGAPKPKMWPEVKEGLRWVIGNRWLRAIAICTGTSNFFSNVLFAIFVLYAVRSLHLSATEIGLVFGVGSFGSIFGALVVNRLQKAIGVGRTILLTAVVFSGAGLAFPLAPRSFPLPLLMVGQACFGFGAVAYNITQVSLRQAITPERLQGRMNAAMRWVVWGTIPIGTLAGGGIATAFGLRAALWAGAIGGCFTFLAIVFSSVRSIREMPKPEPAPTPAQAELAGGLIDGQPLPGPAAADA